MKYVKLFEEYSKYNKTALEYANKYYSDETGKNGYGDYEEILDRLNDFCEQDFPNGLNNMPNKITLYRLLNVESRDSINKNELGVSYVSDKMWFEDYDFLESFLYRYGEEMKRWFIVTIETPSNNIDMSGTLGNRAEYPSEYEFKILDDNNVKILDIEEVDVIKP